MSVSDDIVIKDIADLTHGFSGAEIVSMCQSAAILALEEDLTIKCVYQRHFLEALRSYKPSISKETITFYESFNKRI